MIQEVRALGFEYVELGHGTRISLLEGIQQAVAADEIKISSLHNFCPLPVGVMGPAPDYYLPSSRDENERQCAVRHTLRTIECAAQFGARAIVLHLGLVPMRNYTMQLVGIFAEGKFDTPKFQRCREKAMALRHKKRQPHLDQVYRTLEAILPRAKDAGVVLGIETRGGIEEIPDDDEADQVFTRFGSETLSYWHDVGHAALKEQLGIMTHEGTLNRFRGRTAGMHLQDFAPPVYDHLPAGTGAFDFARLAPFVSENTVLAWEIHPEWKAEQITAHAKRVHDLLRKPVTA